MEDILVGRFEKPEELDITQNRLHVEAQTTFAWLLEHAGDVVPHIQEQLAREMAEKIRYHTKLRTEEMPFGTKWFIDCYVFTPSELRRLMVYMYKTGANRESLNPRLTAGMDETDSKLWDNGRN